MIASTCIGFSPFSMKYLVASMDVEEKDIPPEFKIENCYNMTL